MFDKIWNKLVKKKTEQQFRTSLFYDLIALILLLIGISLLYVYSQPWYPKGILLVLAGLDVLYLYVYIRALVDKTYFKRLYVNAYDERNKEIIKLSAVTSYALVMLVVIYHFGYAFGAELATQEPELMSLSGFCGTLLGSALIGFFGTNLILQKFY